LRNPLKRNQSKEHFGDNNGNKLNVQRKTSKEESYLNKVRQFIFISNEFDL
jgi:hypothetical protein